MDAYYVVTGVSRLTGEREQCSMAAPKPLAQKLLEQWKVKRPKKRVFLRLRLEPFTPPYSINNDYAI
jgi:hypothetical protein